MQPIKVVDQPIKVVDQPIKVVDQPIKVLDQPTKILKHLYQENTENSELYYKCFKKIIKK